MKKLQENFIGTFELTNGSVMVSDPCYSKGTWCQGKLENVKPGTWNAMTLKDNEGYIAQLIAYHSDIKDFSEYEGKKRWKKQPFDIGVDSGQAGFFQEDKFRNDKTSLNLLNYFNNDEEVEKEEGARWYGVCCNLTLSPQMAGVLEGGVVSSSGYGDGGYTLYTLEENKQVVAMKIKFLW